MYKCKAHGGDTRQVARLGMQNEKTFEIRLEVQETSLKHAEVGK